MGKERHISNTLLRIGGKETHNCYQLDSDPVGSRILAAREHKGLTRTVLAKEVGTSYRTLLAWETGTSVPSTDAIKKLSEVLDVTPDWLEYGLMVEEPAFVYDQYSLEEESVQMDEHMILRRRLALLTDQNYLSLLTTETLVRLQPVLHALYLYNLCRKEGRPFEYKSEDGTEIDYLVFREASDEVIGELHSVIDILQEYIELIKQYPKDDDK